MYKQWIFPAGLGIRLAMLAAASAQTGRVGGEAPTTRAAMGGGPWGAMFGPGGADATALADAKAANRRQRRRVESHRTKLRQVLTARRAAESAIDPTNTGAVAAGGFFGRGGRGPDEGFRPPGGPGFGGDSFSGPGGGPGGPGGFGRLGGPSSRPAATQPAGGRPAVGSSLARCGNSAGGPAGCDDPACDDPAGRRLRPAAVGLRAAPGGDFGPPPGGGFGPPPGGGFGPPPGFGGRGGEAMQALAASTLPWPTRRPRPSNSRRRWPPSPPPARSRGPNWRRHRGTSWNCSRASRRPNSSILACLTSPRRNPLERLRIVRLVE